MRPSSVSGCELSCPVIRTGGSICSRCSTRGCIGGASVILRSPPEGVVVDSGIGSELCDIGRAVWRPSVNECCGLHWGLLLSSLNICGRQVYVSNVRQVHVSNVRQVHVSNVRQGHVSNVDRFTFAMFLSRLYVLGPLQIYCQYSCTLVPDTLQK